MVNTLTEPRLLTSGPLDLAAERARGTYEAPACADVIAELEAAGLRGRGGAGFPAHIKWRAVADATLDLMTTFAPNSWGPAWLAKRFAYALMDEPLRRAYRYPTPSRAEEAVFRGVMRLRGRVLRLFPARSRPKWVSGYSYFRTYPAGYRIEDLGTFAHRDHGTAQRGAS